MRMGCWCSGRGRWGPPRPIDGTWRKFMGLCAWHIDQTVHQLGDMGSPTLLPLIGWFGEVTVGLKQVPQMVLLGFAPSSRWEENGSRVPRAGGGFGWTNNMGRLFSGATSWCHATETQKSCLLAQRHFLHVPLCPSAAVRIHRGTESPCPQGGLKTLQDCLNALGGEDLKLLLLSWVQVPKSPSCLVLCGEGRRYHDG